MVRPADIIAHRFRRMAAHEHRPGMAHVPEDRFGVIDRKLQMLGRKPVDIGRGPRQTVEQDARTAIGPAWPGGVRSDEHTSELQSLIRTSYAAFCLNKKQNPPQ